MNRGAIIDQDESFDKTQSSWAEYLDDFIENIYEPVFKPRGVSLDAALILWEVDHVRRRCESIARNTAEPADDWKKEE